MVSKVGAEEKENHCYQRRPTKDKSMFSQEEEEYHENKFSR